MPDTFTPEQISQILEEFFKVVGTRQYIGARYVPIFGRKGEESIEWDNTAPYEPLTIVLYQGNSYTSRQYVPVGVEITNQEFWAITGNYNAQVEMYRRETAAAREVADNALAAANDAQEDIDTLLPKADFSAESTVKDYVDSSVAVVQADIDTLLPKASFSAENTVKKYVDDSVSIVQADIDTLLPKADFSAENTVKKYVDDSVSIVQADIESLKNKFALPDNFDGSNDYEKLQAAITYAEQNNSGVIINRKFDITGHTLIFAKGIGNITVGRNRLTFIGLNNGEIYKGDSGYMFDASPRSGDIAFIGVSFKGDKETARLSRCNVFNLGSIIRLTTICCSFISLNIVFDGANATTIDTNIQSMRHYNDFIYDCYAYYKNGRSWDIYINGAICESSNTFFSVDEINRCTISDSCIEGLSDYGIYLVNTSIGSSLSIDRNYFEANAKCITLDGYLLGCSICDNRFSGAFTNDASVKAIIDIHNLTAGGQATSVDRNVYTSQTDHPDTYLIWTSTSGQFFFANNQGNITPELRFFSKLDTMLYSQHKREMPSNVTRIVDLPAGTYRFTKDEFNTFTDVPIPANAPSAVTVFGEPNVTGMRFGFVSIYSGDNKWHFYMFAQVAGTGTSGLKEL